MCDENATSQVYREAMMEMTRDSISTWIAHAALPLERYLFPSRTVVGAHLSTRQYSRIVANWIGAIGLDPAA